MERIKSLDLARGFTVLFIAPIHTVMLYAAPKLYTTVLGYFLTFIAEGPGAQLFMTLMGMYIAFKPVADTNGVLKRSMMLLLAGYALNMFKFVLPLWLGFMPQAMQQDLQVQNDCHGYLQLLCLGDILQFAAVALPITHWVRRKVHYRNDAALLASAVLFLSPLFWDMDSNNGMVDYLLELVGGRPPRVFFPLLPWLFYPMLGLLMGDAIRQDRRRFYPDLLKWGIGFLLFGMVGHCIAGNGFETSFYRTYPWDTIGHAGIVLICLFIWEWLDGHMLPNPFFRCLEYCSRNITKIYIVQWLVIIWLLPFFGYHELDYCKTLLAIAITSTLTFLITHTIDKIPKK